MAIPADTVWEVQTTGSDSNGGGFSTASKGATGVDMTYASPSVVTFTSTLSGAGGTTLTDSANGFANTMLGNVINISGQGLYCITAYIGAGSVTVDRALGTFSTTTGRVGGAHATLTPTLAPGTAFGAAPGNTVWMKAGTYTLTSSVAINGTNTSGASALPITVNGYASTRGDNGTPPVITSSTANLDLITSTGNALYFVWANLKFTHTGSTRGSAFMLAAATGADYWQFVRVTADGVLYGMNGNRQPNHMSWTLCAALNQTGTYPGTYSSGVFGALYNGSVDGCLVYNNASPCVTAQNATPMIVKRCIFAKNTKGIYQINTTRTANFLSVDQCTFVDNTGDGFRDDTNSVSVPMYNQITRCLFWGNGGYGINYPNLTAAQTAQFAPPISNGFGNNTTADRNNFPAGSGDVTGVSSDPFISRAGLNWGLNSGVGAAFRAAGLPGAFGSATTGYPDIGAVQHQDSGGGVSVIVIED